MPPPMAAGDVGARKFIGEPNFCGEQPGKRGSERVDADAVGRDRLGDTARLVDQGPDFRHVYDEPEVVVMVVPEVAHLCSLPTTATTDCIPGRCR